MLKHMVLSAVLLLGINSLACSDAEQEYNQDGIFFKYPSDWAVKQDEGIVIYSIKTKTAGRLLFADPVCNNGEEKKQLKNFFDQTLKEAPAIYRQPDKTQQISVDGHSVIFTQNSLENRGVKGGVERDYFFKIKVGDYGQFASINYKADRKSTRLNSSHSDRSRMPSSA